MKRCDFTSRSDFHRDPSVPITQFALRRCSRAGNSAGLVGHTRLVQAGRVEEIAARCFQVSMMLEGDASTFVGDGRLWALCEEAWDHFRWQDPIVVSVEDRDGRISTRTPRRLDPGLLSFTMERTEARSIALQPRSDRWEPPFLSLGITRPRFGDSRWKMSWSVLRSAVDEEWFSNHAESHLVALADLSPSAYGFAGLSCWESSGDLNSPLHTWAEIPDGGIDGDDELAGVYWLNLWKAGSIGTAVDAVRELGGVLQEVGTSHVLLRTATHPTALTDDLVSAYMRLFAGQLPAASKFVRLDWWRAGWPT